MESITLIRVDFDSWENSTAAGETEKIVGVFVDGEEENAFVKVQRWMKENGPFSIALAWNDCFYPRFRIEKRTVI